MSELNYWDRPDNAMESEFLHTEASPTYRLPEPSKDAMKFAQELLDPVDIPSLGKKLVIPHNAALITARDASIRAEALKNAATFEELKDSLIGHTEWKSEYVQSAIIMLRVIFEERATLLAGRVKK
jgi:hypothetical protein